jgi:preprotein translocase subunit SecG
VFVVMIVLHVLICIFLVLVVLLQASKGAGLAGAFGGGIGGGIGAVFGGRGAAPFLSKATTVLAIAFMLSCMIQLKLSPAVGKAPKSVIQREAEEKSRTQPAEALPIVPEEMPVVTPGEESETEARPAAVTDTTQP